MKYTLTIQEKHFEALKSLVLHDDKKERVALLLCGYSIAKNDLWDGSAETRFLSKEVVPIPTEQIISHSESHVTWNTTILRSALKQAKENNLQVCLVHSHPKGFNSFSEVDDKNDKELFDTMFKRNGGNIPHLSMVITMDNIVFARACTSKLTYFEISMIRILGKRFSFHYSGKYEYEPKEEFHRQQLAFGKTLNADFSRLRITVVGCGATGTATAHLLARLGVGHILLVDNDYVERSNLSRLYGATAMNADSGDSKAKTLAKYIASLGIGCRVRYIHDWIGSEKCREAAKSSDIIFGCTDDNSGRIFLNRLAYFYLIPFIDMGIVIDPSKTTTDELQTLQGRYTVLLPGNTCLLCRSVVDRQLAREEQLLRNDPDGYQRQKEEAYVVGGNNPSPAVITFTTEIATMAVNELINRITGFKKTGEENHVVRFFDKSFDKRQKVEPDSHCSICASEEYWAKGDVEPFLDQTN